MDAVTELPSNKSDEEDARWEKAEPGALVRRSNPVNYWTTKNLEETVETLLQLLRLNHRHTVLYEECAYQFNYIKKKAQIKKVSRKKQKMTWDVFFKKIFASGMIIVYSERKGCQDYRKQQIFEIDACSIKACVQYFYGVKSAPGRYTNPEVVIKRLLRPMEFKINPHRKKSFDVAVCQKERSVRVAGYLNNVYQDTNRPGEFRIFLKSSRGPRSLLEVSLKRAVVKAVLATMLKSIAGGSMCYGFYIDEPTQEILEKLNREFPDFEEVSYDIALDECRPKALGGPFLRQPRPVSADRAHYRLPRKDSGHKPHTSRLHASDNGRVKSRESGDCASNSGGGSTRVRSSPSRCPW